MAWKFVLFEEDYREADLTLGQALQIEDLMAYTDANGRAVRPDWGDIHPLRSARAALYTAAVMYAARHGIAVAEAIKKCDEVGVKSFVGEVDLNDSDDLPTVMEDGFPQSAGEPSTTS